MKDHRFANTRALCKFIRKGKLLLLATVSLAIASHSGLCQQPIPAWQKAAGDKMSFDVASIRLDTGPFKPPNMGLDDGDGFNPTGGLFSADFPVFVYISFAYKIRLSEDQAEVLMAHLPKWVGSDDYEIRARGPANATKDQMRLMMQSLLADRFKLTVHFENQQVPVLILMLVTPGKRGSMLRPHAECNSITSPPGPPSSTDVFPPVCISYGGVRKPDHTELTGLRDQTMAQIAASVSDMGRLGRPVVDKTGLSGRYDFSIEWTPEPSSAGTSSQSDSSGTNFLEALKEQLGLKLEPAKAPMDVLIVDHIERPTEN